jgi:hypothetical protein
MEIGGNFIKFTAIGVYLQADAVVSALAAKWAGKSADELAADAAFFRDVVTGTQHARSAPPVLALAQTANSLLRACTAQASSRSSRG